MHPCQQLDFSSRSVLDFFFLLNCYRETLICCSAYVCIHWLILVGALTDGTCSLGTGGWYSNQLSYLTRAPFWTSGLLNSKIYSCYFKSLSSDNSLQQQKETDTVLNECSFTESMNRECLWAHFLCPCVFFILLFLLDLQEKLMP